MIELRVDDWELRCRFNHGGYWHRMQAGEFIFKKGKPGKPAKDSGQSAQTVSRQDYYLDKTTQIIVAKVHNYILPDGTISASGKPDPKLLVIGDTEYHKHRGTDETVREPGLLLPFGCGIFYRIYRQAFCYFFGPECDKEWAIPLNRKLRLCFATWEPLKTVRYPII